MASMEQIVSLAMAWAFVSGLTHQLFGDDAVPAGATVQVLAGPYAPVATPMIEGNAAAVPRPTADTPAAHGKRGEKPPKADAPGQEKGKPDEDKNKEAVKPIQRPPAPAATPNPAELAVRPNERGKISLRFNGQPWQPVLEWLATISGMSLDWQELPGDSLNLTTRRSYSVPEVRDLINRLLLARGYTMICHGEVMTIAEIKKIDPSLVPRVEPADLPNHYPFEFVKVSFPLVSLVAESVADELKPMLSPNGKLNSLAETNRLEVMDAVTNLRDVDAILKHEQSDENQRSFRVFPLKHSRAAEVHRLLAELLGLETSKSPPGGEQPGGMDPQQQQQQAMMMGRMPRGNMPGGPQQPGGEAPKPKTAVNIAVNEHSNSLYVRAAPDKMAVIAEVIDAVDIPVSHDDSLLVNLNRMQVYRLTGIEPEPVVKTLMEIGNLDPSTRLEIDKKSSAIIAYASLPDHVTIRAVVDKLTGSERKFEVIPLRRLAADYVAGTIESMMGSGKKEKTRSSPYFNPYGSSEREPTDTSKNFHVDADVENNRLLLWANPVELASVNALLAKLGEGSAPGVSGSGNVRVLEGGDAKETQELIERIRRAWPSVAPNALVAPAAVIPPEGSKEPTRPLPPDRKDSSTAVPLPRPSPSAIAGPAPAGPAVARSAPAVLFRLADMRSDPSGNAPEERPAEEPRQGNARSTPPPAPPVKITVGPDGKLILSSQDSQALDRLEELATQLAAPRKDYHVFRLKYSWAVGVAMRLDDYFKEEKKERPRYSPWWYDDFNPPSDSQDERRLSKRRKLKFISDADSNTILVEGASPEQLKTIEDLVKLYDQPPPTDSQSVRRTEVIRLKYSKAKAVSDTVKDVYRDLLSANDKALADPNQARGGGRNITYNFGDSDSDEPKTPKFKGLLSIGIDEISNTLTVSAPAYLFEHVARLIGQLDEAAAPTYTVQMVHIRPGITAGRVKAILDEVYMQKPAEKPEEERPIGKPAKSSKSSKIKNRQPDQSGSNGAEETP